MGIEALSRQVAKQVHRYNRFPSSGSAANDDDGLLLRVHGFLGGLDDLIVNNQLLIQKDVFRLSLYDFGNVIEKLFAGSVLALFHPSSYRSCISERDIQLQERGELRHIIGSEDGAAGDLLR